MASPMCLTASCDVRWLAWAVQDVAQLPALFNCMAQKMEAKEKDSTNRLQVIIRSQVGHTLCLTSARHTRNPTTAASRHPRR